MLHADHTELMYIEPARNAWRFYYVGVWPDLFGGVSLAREWGRIGQPGQFRLDPYPDAGAARQAMHELVRRKQRKGYREVG